MKRINIKLLPIIALFAAGFCLSSCSFNKGPESDGNRDKNQTEKSGTAAEKTAGITISASISNDTFASDRKLINDDESILLYSDKFLKFRLQGYLFDEENGDYSETPDVTKTWQNYSKIAVDPSVGDLSAGKWKFVLDAYKVIGTIVVDDTTEEETLLYLSAEHSGITLKGGSNIPLEFILISQPNDSIKIDTLITITDYSNKGYNGAVLYAYDYDAFVAADMSTDPLEPQVFYCTQNSASGKDYSEYKLIANLTNKKYWIVGKLVRFKNLQNHEIDTNLLTPYVFCTEQIAGVLSSFAENSYEIGRYKLNLDLGDEDAVYGKITDGDTPDLYDVPTEYFSCSPVYLKAPENPNGIFDGWYLSKTVIGDNVTYEKKLLKGNSEHQNEYVFNQLGTLSKDKTVYAKWIPSITITYHVNGKTFKQIVEQYEDEVELLTENDLHTAPYNLNGKFSGWYKTEQYAIATEPDDNRIYEYLYSLDTESDVDLYGFTSDIRNLNEIDGLNGASLYLEGDYNGETELYGLSNLVAINYADILNSLGKSKLNVELQNGDSISITFDVLANKDLTLAGALIFNYSNYYDCLTTNDNDGSNSHKDFSDINIEKFKKRTITRTFTYNDYSSVTASTNKFFILMDEPYEESIGFETYEWKINNFTNDTIINCNITNVVLNNGKMQFLLWKDRNTTLTNNHTISEIATAENKVNPEDDDDYNYYLPKDNITLPSDIFGDSAPFTLLDWYDNPDLDGDPVTTFSAESQESQFYYAKWGLKPVAESSDPEEPYPDYIATIPLINILPNLNEADVTNKAISITLESKEKFEMLQDAEITDSYGTRKYCLINNEIENSTGDYSFKHKFYTNVISTYSEIPPDAKLKLTFINSEDNPITEPFVINEWYFTGELISSQSSPNLNTIDDDNEYSKYLLYSQNLSGDNNNEPGIYIANTNEYPLMDSREDNLFIRYEDYKDTGIDFVIDDEGYYDSQDDIYHNNSNLYVIYGKHVEKNGITLFNWEDKPEVKLNKLYYYHSGNTKYLFAAGDRGDGTTDFCRYNVDSGVVNYGVFKCRFDGDSSNYTLNDFAANDYFVFFNFVTTKIYTDDPKKQYIEAAKYSINIKGNIEIELFKANPEHPSIISYDDLFGDNNFPYVKVNDMQIVDLSETVDKPAIYLYVLFGAFDFKDSGLHNHEVYSYGFVSRINLPYSYLTSYHTLSCNISSEGISWDKDFGTEGIFFGNNDEDGNAPTIDLSTPTQNYYTTALRLYSSVKSESDFDRILINPQKIVAIMAKKLVFAEDGMFVWMNGDEINVQNVNRIITLDLEENTFATPKYVPGVHFDKNLNLNYSFSAFTYLTSDYSN